MSRISRYQDALSRFIKTKSSISELNKQYKIKITGILDLNDHLISIILLTIQNNKSRKNNIVLHGYYASTAVELLDLYIKFYDSNFLKNSGNNISMNDMNKIIPLINICIADNIDYIKKNNKDKLTDNYFKILNNKLFNIFDEIKISSNNFITKTDLQKYNFKNETILKTKLQKLKIIDKQDLNEYIEKKYGSLCQIAIIFGWLFGFENKDKFELLDKTGIYLGYIIKICYDFQNLEYDLENASDSSTNYIINFGIQESFEIFIHNKFKFIENCFLLDIYTTTIKEIIDLYELKIDNFIDNTTPDLKSYYSLSKNKE
jgi:hypothetical protein